MGIEEMGDYRWCRFCQTRKHRQDFVKIFTVKSRRFVTWKCRACKAAGKLTVPEREEIEARRARDREETNAYKMKLAAQIRADEIKKRLQEKPPNDEPLP